jgi:hypothetical protein
VNYGGNWSPPNQTYHETFRFTIVGNELTGSSSLLGLPRAISRGRVNGRKIAFVTEYPLSEGMQHNIYSGTLLSKLAITHKLGRRIHGT